MVLARDLDCNEPDISAAEYPPLGGTGGPRAMSTAADDDELRSIATLRERSRSNASREFFTTRCGGFGGSSDRKTDIVPWSRLPEQYRGIVIHGAVIEDYERDTE
jgi:hypothetical protein